MGAGRDAVRTKRIYKQRKGKENKMALMGLQPQTFFYVDKSPEPVILKGKISSKISVSLNHRSR